MPGENVRMFAIYFGALRMMLIQSKASNTAGKVMGYRDAS